MIKQEKSEQVLKESAEAVEADDELNKEMQDWDVTVSDGLDDE